MPRDADGAGTKRVSEEELRELLARLDELNADLTPSDVPAWELIREDRDSGH